MKRFNSEKFKDWNFFISNLCILLISVFLIFPIAVSAQEKVYKWKLANSFPAQAKPLVVAIDSVSKHAKELSNGRLIIITETSDIHKKSLGVFDLVQSNEYQMGHSVGFFWQKKDFNTSLLTSIPFGMIAPERYSWFYKGGGNELTQKVYQKHGLKVFPGGNVGMQMGGWFKKEIKELDDLKGLKMRIPGFGGRVMSALGVDVKQTANLNPREINEALGSGVLDAVEWTNPGMDLNLKLFDHAKYYYTGWQEPGVETQFLVNEKAFNSLPKDLQTVLIASMKLAAFEAYINYNHQSIVNLKKMQIDHPDIQLRAFPPKIIRALAKQTKLELLNLAKSGDDLTLEIIKSLLDYQSSARTWTRFGDQAYLNNASSINIDFGKILENK